MENEGRDDTVRDRNDLGVWRGLLLGVLIGALMWAALIGVIWWMLSGRQP